MSFKERVEARNRYAFTIGYDGTDENAETHNRFKKLSEKYDGVYISALRVLLDINDERQQHELLLSYVSTLEERLKAHEDRLNALIAELEVVKQVPEAELVRKKGPKTFGGV